MAKIFKIFMIIVAILVAGCAHHPSHQLGNRTKAELDEIYPITGAHTERGDRTRIISARLMDRKERKIYEEG